jgi:flagellar basal-body rod protein FlgB
VIFEHRILARSPDSMRLDGMPVLAALKEALNYNAARSRVLAGNVANSDTPGFMPQDIAEGDFAAALQDAGRSRTSAATLVQTAPGHMAAPSGATRTWKAEDAPDAETTLDGNAVVLEEQMAKMAETRMRYEAAVGLYEKTLSLVRLAVKSPSR